MLPRAVINLTDSLTPHLAHPLLAGNGVCEVCGDLLKHQRFTRCYRCHQPQLLDAFASISYAVRGTPWYRLLSSYKTIGAPPQQSATAAAALWRFLHLHEPCIAKLAGVDAFDVVTTVPSTRTSAAPVDPLRRVAAAMCWQTLLRHRPLLRPTPGHRAARGFEGTASSRQRR